MNPWFMIAQLLGLATIYFEFASYQIKDKRAYFGRTAWGSFFWTLMFVAMGMATGMSTQLSLVLAAGYSAIRNAVFFFIFKYNTPRSKEFGLNFLIVMIAVALVAGIITVMNAPLEVRWLHGLGLATALAFVVGQYLPGVHYVRITTLFYAAAVIATQTPLNILYGDIRWNFMGIAIEMAKVISIVVFYIRFRNQPQSAGLAFEKL